MKRNGQLLQTILVFLFFCSVHQRAVAQQTNRQIMPEKEAQTKKEAVYSFKLYNAPANAFGYDVYKDGKPVFHQFVMAATTKEGKRIQATKPQAETAAQLAIAKMKKGEPAVLSVKETRHIMAMAD